MSRNFETAGLLDRLVRLRQFVDYLGHSDKKYKIIHVAGTKGKGSTCVLLEGILMEAGVSVGRFTSPHLYSFLERVTVNGVSCSESEFADIMLYIREKINQFDLRLAKDLTFFELLLVFAFEYFARCSVDYVLLEVGLGGRLDATNICLPAVTVIANLSFDHIEQLGPTLRDIAIEKGGIIKSGVPLVSSVCKTEPRIALAEIIDARKTSAYFLGDAFVVQPVTVSAPFRFQTIDGKFPVQIEIDDLNVCMPGRHQRNNASLAIASAFLIGNKFNFNADVIRRGLAKGFLPARVEVFQGVADEPVFVVDGAHNRASAAMFIDTLLDLFPNRRKLLVFGATMGKDVDGMLTDLLPNFDKVFLTQYKSSSRCFPPIGLKTIADAILQTQSSIRYANKSSGSDVRASDKIEVIDDCTIALSKCFELAGKNDIVCATGSIYLAAGLRNFYLNNITKKKIDQQ
ncbi:MAG: hypothetical protein LBJ00_05155 [Planctomycetaceae bacterium]|nr:hypothetical protein [Planctomycetaceae bacterium]